VTSTAIRLRAVEGTGLLGVTVAEAVGYMQDTDRTDNAVLDVLLKEIRYRKYKKTVLMVGRSKHLRSNEIYEWLVALVIFSALTDVQTAAEMTVSMVSDNLKVYAKKLKRNLTEDPFSEKPFLEICRINEFKKYGIAIRKLYSFSQKEMTEEDMLSIISDLRQADNSERKKERVRRGKMAAAGVGVMIAAVVIQGMIYFDRLKEEKLKQSLSQALYVTVNEMYGESTGTVVKEDSNRLLATFMQAMLQRVDDDVDLTVRVCAKDEKNRLVEVEAVGEYMSSLKQKHKVSVRRKIAF
ncbi:MAG: hypothetical protein K5639_08035, partial [Eubacterium sp.]|nr:hypothetical protein [Eubacterium sp.]